MGFRPLRLHPLRQQKAQRLLRVLARKAVGHKVFAPVMGEAFDKQPVAFGQAADLALQLQPVAGVVRAVRASRPAGTSSGCGR
jgi:hypothetical protein